MTDELIDILNDKGNLTGEVKLKTEAHKKGLWHASVQIWFYNFKGEVLLQKRSKNKDTFPNLWDISVAGHLSVGDTPIEAALREIKEEIGLAVKKEELLFLKTIKSSKKLSNSIIDNEFNHLYIIKHPVELNKLKLQQEEVSDVKLISIINFKKELKYNSEKYVPHNSSYYSFIFKNILNSLKK